MATPWCNQMKNFKLCLILGIFLIFCSTSWADIPKLINFQGILTDTSGTPLDDTTVSVEFRVYDALVGGNSKWVETQNVTTDNQGRFNVLLGTVSGISDTVFKDTLRYLSVNVESGGELAPRTKLVSVAYSNRVGTVDGATGGLITGETVVKGAGANDKIALGVSDPNIALELRSGTTLGNPYIDFSNDNASDFDARIQLNGNAGLEITVDSILTIPTGNVGIGTTNPAQMLHVADNARVDDTLFASNVSSLSPLRLQTGGTTRMYIDDVSGSVGIGTTNPQAELHVEGNAHISGNLTKDYMGTPNLAIPIAYASINSDGSVASGTSNVSSVWNAVNERYEITITGESYSASSYVTVVTPRVGGAPEALFATTNSSGGKLIIRVMSSSTGTTGLQKDFQFVIFKP